MPPEPAIALLIPKLATAGENLGAFLKALSNIPQGDLLAQAAEPLLSQLGVDPRSREALREVGLEPQGSAAWMLEKFPRVAGFVGSVALPVTDAKLFRDRLANFARDRWGATVHGELQIEGQTVELLSSPGGRQIAFAIRGHYALLGFGTQGAIPVAQALGRAEVQSLLRSEAYQAARKRTAQSQFTLFVPSASPLWPLPGRGVAGALGVTFEGRRASARAVLLVSPAEGILLSALAKPAGGEAAAVLPSTFLQLRLGGEPSALAPFLSAPSLRPFVQAVRRVGIDPEAEILGNLKPGLALAVGLAKVPDLSSAPSLDPRLFNPFRLVSLNIVGEIRDTNRALKTLEKVAAGGTAYGVNYSQHQLPGGVTTTVARYGLGETLSTTLVGNRLLIAGGPTEMGDALTRLAHPREPVAALAGTESDALLFDPGILVKAIATLPPSIYGGLMGLTLKSMVERLSVPLSHLGPIVLTSRFNSDFAQADLGLTLE